MRVIRPIVGKWWYCLASALFLLGCDGRDARLERVTQQSLAQQAAQNSEMARMQAEVATGAKQLVEADARSRAEFTALHGKLQDEQSAIGHQRDVLDQDRKALAVQRDRDLLLAAALDQAGLLLACLTPLVLGGYALYVASRSSGDDQLTEIAIEQLCLSEPLRLAAEPTPTLPPPDSAGPEEQPPPAIAA